MGHEAIGVVEAVGKEVRKVKKGDFVVMPFAFSDGECPFCHEGLDDFLCSRRLLRLQRRSWRRTSRSDSHSARGWHALSAAGAGRSRAGGVALDAIGCDGNRTSCGRRGPR